MLTKDSFLKSLRPKQPHLCRFSCSHCSKLPYAFSSFWCADPDLCFPKPNSEHCVPYAMMLHPLTWKYLKYLKCYSRVLYFHALTLHFWLSVSTEQMFSLFIDPSPGWMWIIHNPTAPSVHACLYIILTPILPLSCSSLIWMVLAKQGYHCQLANILKN